MKLKLTALFAVAISLLSIGCANDMPFQQVKPGVSTISIPCDAEFQSQSEELFNDALSAHAELDVTFKLEDGLLVFTGEEANILKAVDYAAALCLEREPKTRRKEWRNTRHYLQGAYGTPEYGAQLFHRWVENHYTHTHFAAYMAGATINAHLRAKYAVGPNHVIQAHTCHEGKGTGGWYAQFVLNGPYYYSSVGKDNLAILPPY